MAAAMLAARELKVVNEMMSMKRVWLVMAAGCLVVSACGTAATNEAAVGGEDAEVVYESPLGDFLGWSQDVDFDQEAAEAEWAEQERQVQEAIATCMSAEGFEYLPIDMAAQNAYWNDLYAEELEWGSSEWTAKYGFGVSTQRFNQEQVGPDLAGNPYSSTPEEEPRDPNQDYVDSLGESERQTYYEALQGDDQGYEWDEALTEEENEAVMEDYFENVYVPSGCQHEAQEAIYNQGSQATWDDFEAEFGDIYSELNERIEAHPDVIAYRDGVRSCVEEKGFVFLTDNESYDYFEDELSKAGLGWESEPDPLEGVDTSGFTDEDFQNVYEAAYNQPLAPERLEALAEVQKYEIATAVAHQECGAGWADVEAALQPIRIQVEEEFLVANADRLAPFEGAFSL